MILLKFEQHDGRNLKERVDGLTSKLEELERSSSTCVTLFHDLPYSNTSLQHKRHRTQIRRKHRGPHAIIARRRSSRCFNEALLPRSSYNDTDTTHTSRSHPESLLEFKFVFDICVCIYFFESRTSSVHFRICVKFNFSFSTRIRPSFKFGSAISDVLTFFLTTNSIILLDRILSGLPLH